MKKVMKTVISAVQWISFSALMLLGLVGVFFEIAGYAWYDRICYAIGITKGFVLFYIVFAVLLVLLITSYVIKRKVF